MPAAAPSANGSAPTGANRVAPTSATFPGGGASTSSARPLAPSSTVAATARNLPAAPALRAMQERLGDQARTDATKGANPAAAKLGRNDPCYCGSGLKFKKCHGR